MPREFTPKVITANDLLEGDVVYLTKAGDWTRWHEEAHPALTQEQADTMLAHANTQQGRIVGTYAADARIDEQGKPHPVHFREVFRTRGPSNYQHGKQTERQQTAGMAGH